MSEIVRVGSLHVIQFALEHCPESLHSLVYEHERESELLPLIKKTRVRSEVGARKRLDDMIGRDARHQGVVAEIRLPQGKSLEELLVKSGSGAQVVVVCDGIEDVQNLGAIARATFLLGGQGIIFSDEKMAGLGAGALKASSGVLLMNQFTQVTNLGQALRDLKEQNFWIAGLMAEKSQGKEKIFLAKLKDYEKVALVVGSEHKGIPPSHLKICDFFITIPTRKGFEGVSLNASTAVAISLSFLDLKT